MGVTLIHVVLFMTGGGGNTCRKICCSASGEGAHVDFALRRQRSSSDARMVATTVRLSGWSGLIVLKSLASDIGESAACAALIVARASMAFAVAGKFVPGICRVEPFGF